MRFDWWIQIVPIFSRLGNYSGDSGERLSFFNYDFIVMNHFTGPAFAFMHRFFPMLTAEKIHQALREQKVTHVVGLSDNLCRVLFQSLQTGRGGIRDCRRPAPGR
jgi:hypothetical protein